jgi:predicted outer membrane protein
MSVSMFSLLLAVGCARVSADTCPPELEQARAPAQWNTVDDEIFGVLRNMNQEAIRHGAYMKKWAKSQRVKRYAAMMVHDYQVVGVRQRDMRQQLDVMASASRLGTDFAQDGLQKLRMLHTIARGDTLDRAYVDMQIDMSAGWLAALDHQLIPHARTRELRTELTAQRALVARHHDAALALRAELALTAAPPDRLSQRPAR